MGSQIVYMEVPAVFSATNQTETAENWQVSSTGLEV